MYNKMNIIWSKGPIQNIYSKHNTEFSSSRNEIENIIKSVSPKNNVLFIRNGSQVHDLYWFANSLHLLSIPVVLITSDGDRSMPISHNFSYIQKILMSPMIIKWYTQNYDKSIVHPKLTYMPIGFDLHTPKWLINNSARDKIKFMVNTRLQSTHRISNKILSDTHNSITHNERRILYDLIKYNKYIDFIEKKTFIQITQIYNTYNFALSPRGNGLDCHRTWELLLAGVIVITKTSTLDDMYIDNDLPVVILNDWNELNDNIEYKLQQWYTTYIGKTSIDNIFKKLTFHYWLSKSNV